METANNSPGSSVNETEGIKSERMNLENFTAAGFKILAEATRKSNTLPFGKARDLFESYPVFHNIIDNQADYVLSKLSVLLKRANCKEQIKKRDDEDKFEIVVDANDSILENVGISLDDLAGIKRNPEPQLLTRKLEAVSGSWNRNFSSFTRASTQVLNNILSKTKHIEKPQLKFQDKVNNNQEPFEPKITYKYNMLKPLSCIAEVDDDGTHQFTHPYEFELMKFKPPQDQLTHKPPISYKSLKETPVILVMKPAEVKSMVEDLEKYKEIAVDLEHHSYRTFQGFTCLLQISTRDTDYIVDTLELRSELQELNKVFTDPSVVKVFHGADCDILWLQKDFGIYVVNMFDTHQAAKLLKYPKLSLAYLLSFYCNIHAQKHFQLADWRVRPLPEEMIKYAREDTHYLLYIYDNLRNALIEAGHNKTNLLEAVISESTRICLKKYRKPVFDPEGYLDLYRRSKKLFDNRQKFALQKIFEWRDKTARESDESYAYVLPDHMMLNISEVLPREAQGILACCNPVPQPVRQHLMTLHHIILKARDQLLMKPILEEERFHRHTTAVNSLENPLQCPHDLNHDGEFRDDLPVLFSDKNEAISDVNLSDLGRLSSTPIVDVFESSKKTEKVKSHLPSSKALLTPYHRYKLSKKFSESQLANSVEKEKKDIEETKKECQSESNIKKETDDEESECQKRLEPDGDDSKELLNDEGKKRVKSKRRKFDEPNESVPTKKLKEEINSENLVKNRLSDPNPSENSLAPEKPLKKKKNKKVFVSKSEEFKSFDYSSVNFDRYKSSSTTSTKIEKKKQKLKKKKGKKNFKISI